MHTKSTYVFRRSVVETSPDIISLLNRGAVVGTEDGIYESLSKSNYLGSIVYKDEEPVGFLGVDNVGHFKNANIDRLVVVSNASDKVFKRLLSFTERMLVNAGVVSINAVINWSDKSLDAYFKESSDFIYKGATKSKNYYYKRLISCLSPEFYDDLVLGRDYLYSLRNNVNDIQWGEYRGLWRDSEGVWYICFHDHHRDVYYPTSLMHNMVEE